VLDDPRVHLRDARRTHDHVDVGELPVRLLALAERRDLGEVPGPVGGQVGRLVLHRDQAAGLVRRDGLDGRDPLPAGAPDGNPPACQILQVHERSSVPRFRSHLTVGRSSYHFSPMVTFPQVHCPPSMIRCRHRGRPGPPIQAPARTRPHS
jgi:hypothetical protein